MASDTRPWLRRGASRAASLLLATPLALLLLIHPAAMLDAEGGYSHSLLMLVMWGISNGFIHGVGFDPHSRLWRTLFHPLGGWLLMGLGYLILWQAQG
ncbi:cyd operon YbgE family protein [Pseudomonas flexibilis]|uniref:cyd operon YbgE family protein n=1 Tax=Pseudomonas flexibilis TaxID=706570 RepID=UPI00068DFDC3|nr:cyd operon YbgE family protein [Pseudomonas flexibilis]SCX95900.1 cyd operon protein YbgE [Pseudomonas flexibilis]